MLKRRLSFILIAALAAQAHAQIDLELDEKPTSLKVNGTPYCPCFTPTVTAASPNAVAAPSAAKAKAATAPTPAAQSQSPASTAANASEDEITLGGDEPTPVPSPKAVVPAAKSPQPAAKAASAAGEDEILMEDGTAPAKAASAPSSPTAPVKAAPSPTAKKPTPIATQAGTTPVPTAVPQKMKRHAGKKQKENSYEANSWGVLKKVLFRTTFDGDYSRAIFTDAGNSQFTNGFGGDFRIEAQLYKSFAMGLYFDPVMFTTPGKNVLAGPMGLFGRFIFSHQGQTEFYCIAGGGINSMVSANGKIPYPADFHAFGGLGLIQSFGDNWGLDFNAVYNYYSPDGEPLRTLSGRLGFTYQINWEDF